MEEETAFAEPSYEQCLKSSAVAVKDIVEQLNHLAEAVRNRSFADVSVWISDAWTDAMSAEKICTCQHGQPKIPQLANLINDLRKMLRVISTLFKLDTN
jgi:hypothetical protein